MPAWPHFTEAELRCKCGCGRSDMNDLFMARIEGLRTELDFPFIVSSAFRCSDYNMRISSTGRDGPHTTGRAMDIRIYGIRAFQLVRAAGQAGMKGIGVAQEPNRPHLKRFIHLDDLATMTRPWVWSY